MVRSLEAVFASVFKLFQSRDRLEIRTTEMFFRPNFCCNCGERIQRAEWKLLTSRRFCDVCAIERQGSEWLPRAVVAGGVIVGVFGIGNFLRSGEPPPPVPFRMIEGPAVKRIVNDPVERDLRTLGPADPGPIPLGEAKDSAKLPTRPEADQSLAASPESDARAQPAFYCGAMTKKGKPCTRRVKSKTRCWQHAGQPLASEISSESKFQ